MTMLDTDVEAVLARHREQRERRRQTMLARYGIESMCKSGTYMNAKMVLTEWFPDPDVPGVRMRILRGI